MSVPKFFSFFVPVLKVLNEQSPMKMKILRDAVADEIKLTEEDKAALDDAVRMITNLD